MHILRRVWLVVAQVYALPLLRGVLDALSLWRPVRFFVANKAARNAFFKCFQLNGALFLGSMATMHFGVAPALRGLVALTLQLVDLGADANRDAPAVDGTQPPPPGGDAAVAAATPDLQEQEEGQQMQTQMQMLEASAEFVSELIFRVLWLYPVYCISFILNAAWYQEVADEAQQHFCPPESGERASGSGLGFLKMVRDEIFRLLLVLGFGVQASVLGSLVPGPMGVALSFVCYSWLFSFYCFEYGWSARGWRLLRRTRHFEQDWLYYLGFGAPGAVATTFFPALVNGGVFALVFPLFIAVGAHCDGERMRRQRQQTQGFGGGGGGGGGGGSGSTATITTSDSAASEAAAALERVLDEFRVQLPVFWFPVLLANFLIKMIQLCCCTKWGAPSATDHKNNKAKKKSINKQQKLAPADAGSLSRSSSSSNSSMRATTRSSDRSPQPATRSTRS
jgi:hypothetical protein